MKGSATVFYFIALLLISCGIFAIYEHHKLEIPTPEKIRVWLPTNFQLKEHRANLASENLPEISQYPVVETSLSDIKKSCELKQTQNVIVVLPEKSVVGQAETDSVSYYALTADKKWQHCVCEISKPEYKYNIFFNWEIRLNDQERCLYYFAAEKNFNIYIAVSFLLICGIGILSVSKKLVA